MELIDRAKVERITFQEPSYSDPINVLTEVRDKVRALPTVDAVPVIRCKDCKHMVEHKGYGYLGESAYTCDGNMDGWILPDSYCSMAERKEE